MRSVLRIVDENGAEIREDLISGEVFVKGPSLMSRYLGSQEATDAAFADGWLRTGDIAYCDRGKWYIVDRAKVLLSPFDAPNKI